MPKPEDQPEYTTKEYERIGRMMVHVFESGFTSKGRLYKVSFIRGLVSGFAGALGATLIVGLLLWTLTFLSKVPLLGPITEKVRSTIQRIPSAE